MWKIDVPSEVRSKVEAMAAELNKWINSGKWELFNDDAKALANLYSMNDLLLMGVKYVKLPGNRFYLELPYRELEEKDVEMILMKYAKTASK